MQHHGRLGNRRCAGRNRRRQRHLLTGSTCTLSSQHEIHILHQLCSVLIDEHRVAWRLRQCEACVECGGGGYGAEREDDAPQVVRVGGALSAHPDGGEDDGDGRREQVADTLHGEHGGDHGTTVALAGILGHERGRQRVVAAHTHTQAEAEEAQRSHHTRGRRAKREHLRHCRRDHNVERDAEHGTAAVAVTQVAEQQLAGQCAAQRGGRQREAGVDGQAGRAVLHHAPPRVVIARGDASTLDVVSLRISPARAVRSITRGPRTRAGQNAQILQNLLAVGRLAERTSGSGGARHARV